MHHGQIYPVSKSDPSGPNVQLGLEGDRSCRRKHASSPNWLRVKTLRNLVFTPSTIIRSPIFTSETPEWYRALCFAVGLAPKGRFDPIRKRSCPFTKPGRIFSPESPRSTPAHETTYQSYRFGSRRSSPSSSSSPPQLQSRSRARQASPPRSDGTAGGKLRRTLSRPLTGPPRYSSRAPQPRFSEVPRHQPFDADLLDRLRLRSPKSPSRARPRPPPAAARPQAARRARLPPPWPPARRLRLRALAPVLVRVGARRGRVPRRPCARSGAR